MNVTRKSKRDKSSLDLFSTSPTTEDLCFLKCIYHAPYFGYQISGKSWGISQGCCNHWDCPRCGRMRASHEYGRIVEGCRTLSKGNELYFITITCRGKEMSLEEAEAGYLEWTNRFLDACRAQWKRQGREWHYVQVTERQTRGHPHSHILTPYYPPDLHQGQLKKWETDASGVRKPYVVEALRSDWLEKQCVRAGLGDQYDISIVDKIEGASRYVAKYLFKPTMFSDSWPKGWKRVRYSQRFPKLPEVKTDAMVLVTREDWSNLARKALTVVTYDDTSASEARQALRGHDVFIVQKEREAKIDKNL